MKKVPYILKDLSIRKMPGFPRGLASLNDLAANVNIITGANASGKSSTARMIQQIIWQDNTKGVEVEGSVGLGEDSWEIKLDSGRTLVQRNGKDDQISGLPTAEGKHRYLLALHNLVEGKEVDLAKEIAKDSIGGYDLDAAQLNLGYSPRIFNKGISEYKYLNETDRKYKEVRDQQRELKKDEDSLIDLRLEKEKAEQAARLNKFYDSVADYLEAKLEFTQLAEQINAFPKSMEKLSGDEYDRILDYENQIEGCKSNITKAEAEILINETGISLEIAQKLVAIGTKIRNLTELGLTETVSTRLLVDAAKLINNGLPKRLATHVAVVEPLTDELETISALKDLCDLMI